MILDISAVVAILRNEPEARCFERIIEAAPCRRISAASYLEAACVIDAAKDPVVSRRLDDFLREAECVVEAVTKDRLSSPARPTGTTARAAGTRPN